jgi:hypothetical protein
MYHEFVSRVKGGEVTLKFLQQLDIKFNINNPDYEQRLNNDSFRLAFLKTRDELQKLNFQGVCFLIDGAEFIVRQNWANDAWAYLRGLKDTDTAIKPFLGLLLSGYRDLKEYQQRVGSPLLNIAEIEWLAPLSEEDTKKLISDRAEQEQISLSDERMTSVIEWSGCHPYLIQQTLNILFDDHQTDSCTNLINKLIQHHDKDFSSWWNEEQHSGCFGETEQTVYQALVENRKGTPKTLAQYTGLSRIKVADALEVIAGTGVIRLLDDEYYIVGSRLFEEWVTQQTP